jgi:hypothetical protein
MFAFSLVLSLIALLVLVIILENLSSHRAVVQAALLRK